MRSSKELHASKDDDDRDVNSDDIDEKDDSREKTNLFGVKYLMWFEVGIEGKDPMDHDEEDWGGRIEFGFHRKPFPTEMDDYFLLFEDKCSQLHSCAGRVMGL